MIVSQGNFPLYQTWSPSYTGYSANPTAVSKYTQFGKMCHAWHYQSVGGTSNATTITITLPVAAASDSIVIFPCRTSNNGGAFASGMIITRTGSNIADVYPLISGGTWVNGTARFMFAIVYETL